MFNSISTDIIQYILSFLNTSEKCMLSNKLYGKSGILIFKEMIINKQLLNYSMIQCPYYNWSC